MTSIIETTPARPASLHEALQPFVDMLMDDRMREGIHNTANSYLRLAVLRAGWPATACPSRFVDVLVSHDGEVAVYVNQRAALEPLRAAGFGLRGFILRAGKAVLVDDADATGWEISEPEARS